MTGQRKILQIGNYPPPMCGWAMQTKLVAEELRRRGQICQVLKINENRKVKDAAYIDVQGGGDYLFKVMRFALAGYQLNVHVNGQSKKGYVLALSAALAGRLTLRPALVTFHGGLSQEFFPRPEQGGWRRAFQWLFFLSGGIACDSEEIKKAIIEYGVRAEKVAVVPTFSPRYVNYRPATLPDQIERFLQSRAPVFFCYLSFRPEYELETLRAAMMEFRKHQPQAGCVWLGFPQKELPEAKEFVKRWEAAERASLLLLGNLAHDEFLTLMSRCYACIRTPVCDGVAASVLEALAMGVPVIASENGRRPEGVVAYEPGHAQDLAEKMLLLSENYDEWKLQIGRVAAIDGVARMADWLSGIDVAAPEVEAVHAR